jgi:hypothetical protein
MSGGVENRGRSPQAQQALISGRGVRIDGGLIDLSAQDSGECRSERKHRSGGKHAPFRMIASLKKRLISFS